MTRAENARLQLLIAGLRSLPPTAHLTPGLLLAAVLLAGFYSLPPALLLPLLLTALYQALLAARLRLDAELFQALLDDRVDESELDQWLAQWRKAAVRRPLAEREAGTARLMRRFVLATALLWACTLAICLLAVQQAWPA